MPERQAVQHACGFQLPQAGREHVRAQAEVPLKVTVALRPIEQALDDEECPSSADDVECGGEIAHVVGSVSGFIQNGE